MQLDEVITKAKRLGPYFVEQTFYRAAVPTYVGGVMTFALATDNIATKEALLEHIQQRFSAADIQTRYYNAAIHQESFSLPQYIVNALHQNA